MYTATVSGKGWIVIPKSLRDKYGLKKGEQVQVVEYGSLLAIVPLPADPIQVLQGMLAGGSPLTGELLAERKREQAQEEAGRE